MAESVVRALLSVTVEVLTDRLLIPTAAAKLRKERDKEVERLKEELEFVKVILKDASAKGDQELSDGEKIWVKQVREVSELIEDVVYECTLEATQLRQQRGFVNLLSRTARLIRTLNTVRDQTSKIQNIKATLDEIMARRQRYQLREHGSGSRTAAIIDRYHSQFVSPFLEQCITGIESTATELINGVVTEEVAKRSVISLVGAGGIGKTTLARRIYNDEVVRAAFDCHAWFTVPQSNETVDLLKTMIKKICQAEKRDTGEIDTANRQELISILFKSLRSKRYFLVFDDVWEEDFWQLLKDALPDDENGSRIIITTRSEAVAVSCKETSFDRVHRLQTLSEEASWDLFRHITFQYEPEQVCPPELEQLSRAFIKICEGLPLAIVAVAGLLSTKEKSVQIWQRLVDNFSLEVESSPQLTGLSKILSLSFSDLPYHLKLCFLYFGIFPKDSLIPYDKLFKLWIAEGFVQEQRGKTLEKVAEEYLNELIDRNLVQAFEGFYGLEKCCRVQSLMHEISRQKADEFSFCHIRDDNNSSCQGKSRRLAIYNDIKGNVWESIGESRIRSVLLFNIGALNKSFLAALFGRYKLLTLLDFEDTPLEDLPYEVGTLLGLKYLSLKKTKVKRLPKSVEVATALFACIEAMNHLESLSLSFKNDGGILNLESISSPPPHLERLVLKCRLQVLPDWISGLQNLSMLCLSLSSLIEDPLRHVGVLPNLVSLWLYRAYEGAQLHFEVGGFRKLKLLVLRDLQGLEVVEIEEGALPLLEELRIGPSPLLNGVPSGIQHLRSLKVLAFYDMPNEFVSSIQPDGGSEYVKVEHLPSVLFCDRFSFFSDDIED
ncbi:hypothetical protein TIFTF001_040998 [Ficus carica]|uniref:Uncharacterized protein n=1 Tax=Ficus carica TaxID=3494 RepID=A0AA87Z9I2_FICCA|nr:hypothetical protein TIFTF001_040998 [Ficus carica]